MQSNFWIPELRGPIVLEPYQSDALNEAFSIGDDGLFKYSVVIWSDIKKSAKSSIAASVALYMAEHNDYAEIYVIANDLNQANSRVNEYLRRALTLNPDFRKKYRERGYVTINSNNRSKVEAIPIDPSGEAGSNAELLIWSELWGSNEEAKQRMFSEMTLSPTKFGKSMRWIESYAGFSEESALLWSLYDLGVRSGTRLWPDRMYKDNERGESPLELYVNPEARMLCLWNTRPRCPWQTEAYYKSERAILTPNEYNRMHRNQWVTSEETFVPIEWWDACKVEPLPAPARPNTEKIVAADAGIASDTFGVVMGYRHPTEPETAVVEYAKKWTPPKGGRLDFLGTEENPGPETELRRLFKENNVVEFTYDEYQLADMAGRFSREGLVWCKRFSQGSDRLIADSMLRDKIRNRTMMHDGNLDLRDHLQNANAKTDEKEDRKIRIVKRMATLKVDLAVSLSMFSHEIMRLNL